MAKYQPVLNSTWGDPVFQSWGSDAKLLFLNLITSHRNNPLGLYAVSKITLAFETSLTGDRLEVAFKEIQTPQNGYTRVRYDEERGVIWITNAMKHQPGIVSENKYMLQHIQAILRQYADSPLVGDLVSHYSKRGYAWAFKGLGRGYVGATKVSNRLGKVRLGTTTNTNKVQLPTPETPPRLLTTDEQAVLAYLQQTSPINRLQDPERVMRRLFDAYSDVGPKWILGELRKIVSYCAARGEWEGQRKDWAATIRNWLKRAYGDPSAREQIKALISKVGNIPAKQPVGAHA